MPAFTFSIPPLGGGPVAETWELDQGESAFVLGANGTGKSSLMHLLYSHYSEATVRLSAHRQTWFASASLELSPQSKRDSEKSIRNRDSRPDSRWKDEYAAVRANIAVYELIDAENARARRIAAAVDAGQMDEAAQAAVTEAPVTIINDLLRLSGLPIEISIEQSERVVARKNGSEPYIIAQLSDGERNALLIAASVLTAKPGSLILIDEPERHLHRSIVSPLLTHLFARRSDCAFIVSTHDVILAADHQDSKLLLVRDCTFGGETPNGWAIDFLDPPYSLPDELKLDIYGARSKILFVEGTEDSLDKPLYGILFPDATVVPKGNCREVERATLGVHDAEEIHWVKAYGIIDGDGRSDSECATLADQGLCAIASYSVESIYYHEAIIRCVAERVSALDGSDAAQRTDDAKQAAITAMVEHRERLCARIGAQKLHEHVLSQIPRAAEMETAAALTIEVPVPAIVEKEHERFDAAVQTSDYQHLVNRYPVRETPALARVAAALGFSGRRAYESAVLKALGDDPSVRDTILGLLGVLPDLMSAAGDAEEPQEAQPPTQAA